MKRTTTTLLIGSVFSLLGMWAALAPALGASPAVSQVAQQSGSEEEQAFVNKINALRSSLGLGSLSVDNELTSEARTWAQTMKDSGGIFHSSNLAKGISANWKKLGENVGVGGTVDDLFAAFVASPKHYENLVDPAYTSVGIGVVWADGRMYTAHRFMAVFPASAPAPTPTPTNAPPPKAPAIPNTAPQPKSPAPPAAAAAPPEELAATEPEQTTTTTTAPPPTTVPPPSAQPDRINGILDAVEAFAT